VERRQAEALAFAVDEVMLESISIA